MAVSPIPAGYHAVTPYLIVDGAARAIEFYKQAFGAVELMRLPGPGGKLMHAEVKIGDSPVMLADQGNGQLAPQPGATPPVSFMIYVPDVGRVFARALAAGATEQRPVTDQFYGDRMGMLVDPFGHVWGIATHVEDVAPEEIDRRFAQMMQQE